MTQGKRKPPGWGRLSGRDVRADGFDTTDINSRSNSRKPNGAPIWSPAGFNPAMHPIIAEHWFGIESFHQIGDVAAVVVASLKHECVAAAHRVEGLRGASDASA